MAYDISIEVDDVAAGSVDVESLERLVTAALEGGDLDARAGLSLVIAGDDLLQRLNREHRDVDAPTDVLSFPAAESLEGEEPFPVPEDDLHQAPYLGDIAVSVETVRRQAPEVGLSFELELEHVVLHGLLHLLGYDHETAEERAEMRAREESLLGPEIHASEAAHRDE